MHQLDVISFARLGERGAHADMRAEPSALRLLAAGEGDHADDDQPCQDQAEAGAEAEGVEHGDQEEEEQGGAPEAGDVGIAAGDRGAADDHDGDRGEQVFRAHVQGRAAGEAGEDEAAEAGEDGAEHIGGEADEIDLHAGQQGGAGILADSDHRAAIDCAVN